MVPFKTLVLTLALYLLQGAGASLIQLINNGYEDVVIAIDPDLPEDENLIPQIQGAGASHIQLINNGYEDVVIAIDPDLPEDENLILQIQNMVTEASAHLYKATEKRFYFKEVSILIPKAWSKKSNYEKPKLETYNNADIIIEVPNPPGNDAPRTDQFGQCGEKGERIYLTPDIILEKKLNEYGPPGKILVHEWAHLRWGVFDEYNEVDHFYISDGKNVPVKCSEAITGKNRAYVCSGGSCSQRSCRMDPNTGMFNKECVFIPDKNQTAKASIMFMQSIDSVVEFCTEKNHNKDAPNAQNNKCNRRSTWEVIQDSDDYKTSTPMTAEQPPKPSFSLKQIRERILCLVLDKSGSMATGDRLNRMNQASKFFLLQIIEEGSWAGIIPFDDAASTQSELIQIETSAQRNTLIGMLPAVASGGLSICSGLRSAFTVIRKKFPTDGSEIILLTAGEDNKISDCFDEVRQSGAIIHTVALGPYAAKELEELADMTGGLKTTATDNAQNNGLTDAFSTFSSGNGMITQRSIQLESKGATLKNGEWMNGTVIIDSTIANGTLFLVTWTAQQPQMFVSDSSGKMYNTSTVDANSKMAHFQIPNTAKVGSWTYSLKSSFAQTLTLTVISHASNPTVLPITVDSKMNKDTSSFPSPMVVYAEVRQGSLPIIGATVTALIESADGTTVTLELLDNGAGADASKNDGVYSRYFTAYKSNGRYSLKVRALGGTNTHRSRPQVNAALYIPGWVENGEVKMNPPRPELNVDNLQEKQVYFSRTTSGGSFVVNNIARGSIQDVFPPCQITDLKAQIEGNRINLTWTAPGDDYDYGRAQQYIIRMSESILDLRDKFDDALQVDTTDLIPEEANSQEDFVFEPKDVHLVNGTNIYIAIQAVDKANLKSKLSNIAQVNVFIPPEETPYTNSHILK